MQLEMLFLWLLLHGLLWSYRYYTFQAFCLFPHTDDILSGCNCVHNTNCCVAHECKCGIMLISQTPFMATDSDHQPINQYISSKLKQD